MGLWFYDLLNLHLHVTMKSYNKHVQKCTWGYDFGMIYYSLCISELQMSNNLINVK